MMRSIPVAALLLFTASAALAASADLNVNGDAARFIFAFPAGNDRLEADLGWLHESDEGDLGHAGFHVAGNATSGPNPLRVGVGARAFLLDAKLEDGSALGIGGFARYKLARYDRIVIGARIYYAPEVLAFGGAEELREIGLHAGYSILENAEVYVGYRYIDAEFERGIEATVDSDVHIGLRLSF